MVKHRTHCIEFMRQVAREMLAGETLHGLARRHDISRNLIRIWVGNYEAGMFDEDAQAADLIRGFESRIATREQLRGLRGLTRRMVLTVLPAGLAAEYLRAEEFRNMPQREPEPKDETVFEHGVVEWDVFE